MTATRPQALRGGSHAAPCARGRAEGPLCPGLSPAALGHCCTSGLSVTAAAGLPLESADPSSNPAPSGCEASGTERRGSQLRAPLGASPLGGLAEGWQVGGQAVLENPRGANSFHCFFTQTRLL